MSREFPGGAPATGVGRQNGSTLDAAIRGADRADAPLDARQAVEDRDADDLGAGSEAEMLARQARSAPSPADVRSDDQGVPNGEPL
jgi:hypothetical protein